MTDVQAALARGRRGVKGSGGMADWCERVAVLDGLPVFAVVIEAGAVVWANRAAIDAGCGEVLARAGRLVELPNARWLSMTRAALDADRELAIGVDATAIMERVASRVLGARLANDPLGLLRVAGIDIRALMP